MREGRSFTGGGLLPLKHNGVGFDLSERCLQELSGIYRSDERLEYVITCEVREMRFVGYIL